MKKEVKKESTKNIVALGATSFFNDVGSEMITPVLPFFINSFGGGGLAIGLVSGCREGFSSLFKLLGGWFSDKLGKKMPFIFFGYFFSIIIRFILSLANSWQYIVTFVSLERFSKLRDAPRDVIIASSTNKRGRGFGLHQAMDTGGAIVGALLVLFLFWKFKLSFQTLLLIAGGISIFSLIPLFFVKETKSKKMHQHLLTGIKNIDPKLKYFILVSSVFVLGNFGLYMFIILKAQEITGSITYGLLLFALFNIVWAGLTFPFGNLSDKIGRKKVLLMGYILFFIVTVCFIFQQSIFFLTILFLLYGLVYAMTQSNQRAFVSDLSGEMKGTAMGFFNCITGVVNIPAGLIAGLLWDISPKIMFIYLSVIAFIAIILLMKVRE